MSGLGRRLYIAGLVVAIVCLAVVSWRDAALQYWRRQAMDGTAVGNDIPSLFAQDPQVRIGLALVRFQNGDVGRAEAEALSNDARTVLRFDPLSPAALYTLGAATEQARPGAGVPLLILAERESRRLIYTELALETSFAARGDLPGAVARIDDLATVAPDLTVPIFTSIGPALPDPALRAAFAAYADRPWFGYLAKSAVENGVDTDTVLALLRSGQRSIAPSTRAAIYAALIRRAVSVRDFDAAQRLAGALPSRDRRTISDIGFSLESIDPRLSVLGWELFNDATTSSAVGNERDLLVTVGAEQSQVVATRTTLFPPGDYDFTQTVVHDTPSPRAGLTWNMACATSPDIPLWHQSMPDRGGPTQTYRALVTIPSDCNVQDWRLVAQGASGQVPSKVIVAGLQLHRR